MSLQALATGSIVCYTKGDRLFEVEFSYKAVEEKILFKQFIKATPALSYDVQIPNQQYEPEFNMMCSIPEKNFSKIDGYPEFIMVIRCNSICKIPFSHLLTLDAEQFTGFEGTKFETGKLENVLNTVQVHFQDESDWEKINQSLH